MSLRDVFESIDKSLLDQWVASSRQEDLHLDFKRLDPGNDLARNGRKNLAIAISGFSNSDGGLIVWGVDCRRDNTNVDGASSLVPITNVAARLSQLQTHTRDASTPTVDGVEHRLIA